MTPSCRRGSIVDDFIARIPLAPSTQRPMIARKRYGENLFRAIRAFRQPIGDKGPADRGRGA
ncbi:hypothetical protein I546_2481 [Mycobacterium kansasii 732]|nr:hypothetical protein I546_2481 [Mycobacterium kansasii 732]